MLFLTWKSTFGADVRLGRVLDAVYNCGADSEGDWVVVRLVYAANGGGIVLFEDT